MAMLYAVVSGFSRIRSIRSKRERASCQRCALLHAAIALLTASSVGRMPDLDIWLSSCSASFHALALAHAAMAEL